MKRKITISITVLLLFTIIACCAFTYNNSIYAATSGVHQSRIVAEIEEFPDSYQDGLRSVKAAYPEATFIYFDTGLDWYEDLLSPANEMLIGRNLVPASSPSSWKRVDREVYDMETDEYKQIEPNWNAASESIISYYMDPRNFFTTTGIFQFSELSFNSSQTVAGTEVLLSGTFMSSDNGAIVVDDDGNEMTYAEALVKIGQMVDVSPYMLASRIIQEQGSRGTVLCNGAPNFQGGAYSGCFNYFNVCAYGSSTEAIIENGLSYAQSQGWTSRWRGLLGGAKVVGSWYVDSGMDTLYLQHFNVAANEAGRVSYAPYMANVTAPESEARSFYRACQSTNEKMVFVIPVYDNMPAEACPKPDGDGNGNYWLRSLSINGELIEDFDTAKGKYTVFVNESVNSAEIEAVPYRETTISINGQMEKEQTTEYVSTATLNFGYNEFTLSVKAENGNVKAYSIEIVRDNGEPYYSFSKFDFSNQYATLKNPCNVERLTKTTKLLNCYFTITDKDGNWKSAESMIATGDTLTIRDDNDNVILRRTIILRGDINQDGSVDSGDLLESVKVKLKLSQLSQLTTQAVDINGDNFDANDLIQLNKLCTYRTKELSDSNILIQNTDAFANEQFEVSLQIPEGSYIFEGYLTYNNNFIKALDINNTGSVHFIAFNGNILFENGQSTVPFISATPESSVTMEVRLVTAYDCDTNQDLNIDIAEANIDIAGSDLKISCNNTDTVAYHDGPVVELTIEKFGHCDVTNLTIELPNSVKALPDEHQITIDVVEGATILSLCSDDVIDGVYNLPIKYSYKLNGESVEKETTLYYQIKKCDHREAEFQKVDIEQHERICEYCQQKETKEHRFTQNGNEYVCIDCGYSTNFNMIITAEEFESNKASSVNVVITQEDSEYTGNVIYEWYMDSVRIANTKATWTDKIKDVNTHQITCVAILENGLILSQSTEITNKETEFHMNKIRCNMLIAAMSPQEYDYRINDGEWQTSSTFKNLTPNTTYTLSRRLRSDHNQVDTIYVTTMHNVTYTTSQKATCTSNTIESGWCPNCNQNIKREIPGTQIDHIYSSYYVIKEATCQGGSIWKAKCDYGCEQTNQIINENMGGHVFTEYVYNNDATCISNGTQTARCEYGCDAYNTILAPNTAMGHLFVDYQEIDSQRIANCEHNCGQQNTITMNTQVVEYIDITLGKISSGQTGMPTIQINTSGVVFDNYLLKTENNEITKETAKGVIEESQIYVLSELSFKPSTGYVLADDVQLYINGELIDCASVVSNGILSFIDIGRFKT